MEEHTGYYAAAERYIFKNFQNVIEDTQNIKEESQEIKLFVIHM